MTPTPLDSAARAFGRPTFAGAGGPSFAGARPALLGQTFDQMMGLPAWTGDVIRLAVHGSTAALGLYVGTLDKGFISTVGWVVGVLSGFAAVLDVASLIGRIFGRE